METIWLHGSLGTMLVNEHVQYSNGFHPFLRTGLRNRLLVVVSQASLIPFHSTFQYWQTDEVTKKLGLQNGMDVPLLLMCEMDTSLMAVFSCVCINRC